MKWSLLLALPFLMGINRPAPMRGIPINSINPNYVHPEQKKIGDRIPFHRGQEVYTMPIFKQNVKTREKKQIGIIYGLSRDANTKAEYAHIYRFCDNYDRGGTPYAVLDIPNKALYIDSSRNRRIDEIIEGVGMLEMSLLPMIPIKCK